MDIPDLPPYRIVVVVDVAGSSTRRSAEMPKLMGDVVRLLREAVERAGLAGEEWYFPQPSGDGYAFGLRAAVAPVVLDALPRALQQVLAEEAERLPRHAVPLRMRAALHLGHVPDEGSSVPLVEAHRLVDSAPLREALARTDPEVTHLAVILSQRVFTDVVAAGYSALRPGELTPVAARVKEFGQRAFVYVPRPSGRWLGAGLAAQGTAHRLGPAARRPPENGPTVHLERLAAPPVLQEPA